MVEVLKFPVCRNLHPAHRIGVSGIRTMVF